MQSVGRFAGKAVPVVVGATVAATAPPVAHADAIQPADVAVRRIPDEWELADLAPLEGKTQVLFSPADIDGAVALLTRPPLPHSAAIGELPAGGDASSDASSDVSSDGALDAFIERSTLSGALVQDDGSQGSSSSSMTAYGMDPALFAVAARLLKSPGVQREILSAAVADPEVFDILSSKCDLPAYLEGQGFAARGLLEGAERYGSAMVGSDSERSTEGVNVLEFVSGWAADRVEELGQAVVRLGQWLRTQLATAGGQQTPAQHTPASGAAEAAAGASAGGGKGASAHAAAHKRLASGRTLTAVMAVCVAIVGVLLLRKPGHLQRLLRQMARARRRG